MATEQIVITGILHTDQRDFYPDPNRVARLHPLVTPFVSDLFQQAPETAPDVDYKMFQKEPTWREQYIEINNGSGEAWDSDGTPSDTNTVTVDTFVGVEASDSVENLLVEIWSSDHTAFRGVAIITTYTNATTLILTSVGNPSATDEAIANLVDDDRLYVIGHAGGETETSPEAYAGDPEIVLNSLQHIRTPLELSYDLANAALRGVQAGRGPDTDGAVSKLAELQTDKMDEHKIRIERALWGSHRVGGLGGSQEAFGADSTGATTDSDNYTHTADSTNGRRRTTMGYLRAVERYGKRLDSASDQSYFVRSKGAYDFEQFDKDMDKIFQFMDDPAMPGMKRAYCGPRVYSFWTLFARRENVTNRDVGDPRFGEHIRILETPSGALELVKMPDWRGRYENYCAIPTRRFLRLRVLTNSGEGTEDPGLMGYFPDILKDNRPLKRKDEYHSHLGLDIQHLKSQALMIFN